VQSDFWLTPYIISSHCGTNGLFIHNQYGSDFYMEVTLQHIMPSSVYHQDLY